MVWKTKTQRLKDNSEIMYLTCGELGYDVFALTEYQYRIQIGDRRLDYFPQSGKGTWVGTNIFTQIGEIDKFLYSLPESKNIFKQLGNNKK